MLVQTVSAADVNKKTNFCAVVNIKANPYYLNGKAIEELRTIGKDIGDDNTKIDMFVGAVKDNPYVYKFSHKTELTVAERFKQENISYETDENVVTPTITPLEYGKNLMGRIKMFVAQNTIKR